MKTNCCKPRNVPKKIAVIDIGTNSVLLLVVQKDRDGKIKVLADEAKVTRLGEGLHHSGLLKKDAMTRTIAVLKDYASKARKRGAEKIIAIGTEALRRAANSSEFVRAAKKDCGLDIKIISEKEEARLSYAAARYDFGRGVVVIDIGGGSTEIITKDGGISFKLGAVTLLEKYLHSDPITGGELGNMYREIIEALRPIAAGFGDWSKMLRCEAGRRGGQRRRWAFFTSPLIGVAGTCTTLAAMHLRLKKYSHSEVHGHKLGLKDIEAIISTLKPLTLEERKKLPGLEPQRADVILPGAVILVEAMRLLKKTEVIVSDHGVRWGIIIGDVPPSTTY